LMAKVNVSESTINLVNIDRPKMLEGLNQKVRGWLPPFHMGAHGHNAAGG